MTSWIFGAARAASSRRRRACSARASIAIASSAGRQRRAVAIGARDSGGERRDRVERAAGDERRQRVLAGRAEAEAGGGRAQLVGERPGAAPPDLLQRPADRQPRLDGDAQEVEHVGELVAHARARGRERGGRA